MSRLLISSACFTRLTGVTIHGLDRVKTDGGNCKKGNVWPCLAILGRTRARNDFPFPRQARTNGVVTRVNDTGSCNSLTWSASSHGFLKNVTQDQPEFQITGSARGTPQHAKDLRRAFSLLDRVICFSRDG